MIATSFLIAIAVNGLMINPGYQWLLHKLKLKKPFNCVLCLSWWVGVTYAVASLNILSVVIPLAASFLAVFLQRIYDSLPSTFR
ncbi:hypothetical protein BDD43_2821 [Mucilaginibacter gracilis]|uniref:Uncharacterized protein n=1 Tax=Mucilaginibacter gracilis TaxID=423350 RepID=A0A495J0X4_9SPHI|nr:hypothetical protein BDD43_2821 [Mucilaginibacter gracilis]